MSERAKNGENLVMLLNFDMLNEAAKDKIEREVGKCSLVHKYAWLLAVKLPQGQTLAAYPISTLNPLAPPSFYMTDPECTVGVCNKEYPSVIERRLKKHCKDPALRDAVKLLKKAVNAIST